MINDMFWVILSKPNKPKELTIIKGTVTTHNKLIIAVRDTERATSPLANEVSMFEVTPPGAAAIIMTPIAS